MLIASAVAAVLSIGPAGAMAASADDLAQIREQLQGLMQRVDKLEQENTELKAENENLKAQDDYLKAETKGLRKDAATLASDAGKVKGADWAGRITAKGDLRYRYEWIEDPTRQGVVSGLQGVNETEQSRHRIRARLGFDAKITDTLLVGLQVATGGDDPRSSNQTLGGASSRKAIGFDLAYFDWKFATWGNLIGGKMKYPFLRPGQSLFYDGDVNPEGLAMQFNRGMFFGSAFGFLVDERNNAARSSTSSSTPATTTLTNCIAEAGRTCSKDVYTLGAQIGARFPIGSSTLVAAVGYSDLKNGQGQRPFYNNNANGNTLTGPFSGLAYDYNIIEGLAEFNTQVGTLPLQVWANYAQNEDPDDLNTAWGAGVLLGKASNYRTWEAGFGYQVVEKDALFGQVIDSDFGDGTTDTEGWVIRAGWAPVRNTSLNATYFINSRFVDVPVNAVYGTKTDYDRLQLDFNMKF
ncbi:putative porin [Povalibacter uvarum]|nr:putative porin [Povalibacter uvarum]